MAFFPGRSVSSPKNLPWGWLEIAFSTVAGAAFPRVQCLVCGVVAVPQQFHI